MTRAAVLVLAVICSTCLKAETRAYGYIKNYSLTQDEFQIGSIDIDRLYSSQFSGRVMLDMAGERTAFQLHYEAGRDVNSSNINVPFTLPERNSYRWSDVTPTPGGNTSKSINRQNLDRLNIQVTLRSGDLTIGRQAIAFGSARIINPTDVFLPFDVQTLNTEYRIGIDAIRFQRPVGQLSEVDLGLVIGNDGSANSAGFARFKTNFNGSDLELTMIRFSEQNLIGFGTETTLGSFGAWFEAASVTGDADYVRTSFGLDYGFSENWFAMLEYHYNGAGTESPADYSLQLGTRPYTAGGVFLSAKQYLIPTISWQISPLTTASFQLLANLDDQSIFANAGIDFSLSDNLYLGLQVFAFNGKQAEQSTLPVLNSEYGNNPDRLIASLRYYF